MLNGIGIERMGVHPRVFEVEKDASQSETPMGKDQEMDL